MKQLIKKMLKLPIAILKKVMVPLMVLWKCWVAAWKRRNICVYLLARRYCKIKEKTILWEAFDGRGILDNPKALFEAMLADPDFKDWKHIWVLDDFKNHEETFKRFKGIRNLSFVTLESAKQIYLLATARVIVHNSARQRFFVKREGQIYIETWHGVPLKTLGRCAKDLNLTSLTYSIRSLLQANYLVSACPFLSQVYKRDFCLGNLFSGKILEVGYPRLDTITHSNKDEVLANLVRAGITIDPKKKILLYAPTWRGAAYATPDTAIEPYLEVKRTLEKILDLAQWQVLIKPHQIVYKAAREQFKDIDCMVPATIDANEVLAITDVLVSDFSSIFYDFLLTKRPIVFYIPDLAEYKESRGIYNPVETLPGPICQSLEELAGVFRDLDAAVAPFAERYAEQRTWAGCDFDRGTNSRTIMRHILLGEPATIAEKEFEKKKILFTLPPHQKRSVVSSLIAVLNKIDFTQYDVTLFTEGDKIGTLERLANELPKEVRVMVRLGFFRTFIDEVRNHYYYTWGASTKKGRLVCPKRYFQEEITRYLANNVFDEVIDVTGGSLFYTTFASLVPAKKRLIWAHENLCETVQTTQKHLRKVFGLYSKFDAIVFHNEAFCTNNQSKLPQYCGSKCSVRPLNTLADVPVQEALSVEPKTPPAFTFSIIMAVYNVELYLREAIESVIKQDIGFENHVQLILVDDGSPDNSGVICDEYAAKYPENVVVIHKENGGVSSARNAGIDVATGQYLNFMDPDDKLSLNTLSKVKAFYTEHASEVDIATIPVFFFEAFKGPHPTNLKFNRGTRIVDLLKEPEVVQCHVATAFIRKSVVKGERFSSNLTYAEDGYFIQTLLLRSPSLGVITGCKYFYRKRKNGTSALQNRGRSPSFYQTPHYFYLPYIRKAKAVFGNIPRFVACVLSYYLQWDIKSITSIPEDIGLSKDECEKCKSEYLEALKFADDDFIVNSRDIYLEHRLAYFRTKYSKQPQLRRLGQNTVITFSAIPNTFTYPFLQWHSMRAEKGKIFICVAFVQFAGLPDVESVFAKCGTKIFEASHLASKDGALFMDEPMFRRRLYEIEIEESELPKTAHLTFHFTQGGITYQATRISRHHHFPLSDQFAAAYCILNKKCILARGATLIITDDYHHWKKELKLLVEIFKKRKGRWKEDLFIRVLRFVRQKMHFKPIWILHATIKSDDDNACAFFHYLRKYHPEIDARIVLSPLALDYNKLVLTGKVLEQGSRLHRMMCTLAEVYISSHFAHPEWHGASHPLRDIFRTQPFVFLTHGPISLGSSDLAWRFDVNYAGVVSATFMERNGILLGDYGYNNAQVWLTGFPQHDSLCSCESKQITIMPTWCAWLVGKVAPQTRRSETHLDFMNSTYYRFYNELLTHPRLLEAAKTLGYKICFAPYPIFHDIYTELFEIKGVFVKPLEMSNKDLFAQSSLVLSDYSSAVFDFAYLRKPILYAHFDKEKLFSGKENVTKGSFDDERDGFGEVTYTLEETVDYLIDYMQQGCQLKDKYRERIDRFFAFNDQNNCERVYQKVRELIQQ